MKKYLFTMILAIVGCMTAISQNDIIVLNDGTVINVYNIDYTPADKCYYSLDESGEQMKSIQKSDVLIIKLSDGTKIDPTLYSTYESAIKGSNQILTNPNAHEPHTLTINGDFVEDKKGNKILKVDDGKNPILFMRLISAVDKYLAVTKWQGKGAYSCEKYIIPEYIFLNGNRYTTVAIDDEAFFCKSKGGLMAVRLGDDKIKEIIFPNTLKTIGNKSFSQNIGLTKIILPDDLEVIGNNAFDWCGSACPNFQQLYIPVGVKHIGTDAFRHVGPNTSYKGYFQGFLSCIPVYVTTGNCTNFGIDEEAIEAYEKLHK